MTFADLAASDAVFLDANTLVYHFVAELNGTVTMPYCPLSPADFAFSISLRSA
jgi:hypothetical protein